MAKKSQTNKKTVAPKESKPTPARDKPSAVKYPEQTRSVPGEEWIAESNISNEGKIIARPGDTIFLSPAQSDHYLASAPGSITRKTD